MSTLQRNNVRVTGRGTRPIIFAHGFGCDQEMWRFVAPQFEDDHLVVLFDYVGAGGSDWSAYDARRYATLDGYKRDVLELCEALDLEGAVWVGHSVSAMIGAMASVEAPELFERLVMVAPSPSFTNHPPDYFGGFERRDLEGLVEMMERDFRGWASFLAPIVIGVPDRAEIVRELEQSFCATEFDIARRFARATFLSDNRAILPRVPIPSLVLQCSADALAPREVGRYLNRHLRGSELRVLKAIGHCPHLTRPDETARAIREYLARG